VQADGRVIGPRLDALGPLDAAAAARAGPDRARAWLQSPARRLMLDLEALPALAGAPRPGWDPGALDASRGRLRACIPPGDPSPPPPGRALLGWAPEAADPHPAARALVLLEQGEPPSLRGAALGFLLREAAERPGWTTPGPTELRRSLREDLPPLLALALDRDRPGAGLDRARARVEAALLRHAEALAAAAGLDGPAARWDLARWLQRVIGASPFWRLDPPVLAARLEALLPADPPPPAPRGPAWVAAAGVPEVFLVLGVAAGVQVAQPYAPAPVLDALRQLAHAELGPPNPEDEPGGDDPLGWTALCPHSRPDWAARWLLTLRLGAPWLAGAPEPVRVGSLAALAAAPGRWGWVARAWHDEGPTLDAAAAAPALQALPALGAAPWAAGLVAAGVARHLPEDQLRAALGAAAAAGDWAPVIFAGLARHPPAWAPAVEGLLQLAEADAGADKLRLNALLRALALLDRPPPGAEARAAALQRARALGPRPPFRDHLSLQQMLLRVGR
jgi:hypothetical protein